MREKLNDFMDDLDEIIIQVEDMRNMLIFPSLEEVAPDAEEYKYQSIINIQRRLLKKLNKDIHNLYRKVADAELDALNERL